MPPPPPMPPGPPCLRHRPSHPCLGHAADAAASLVHLPHMTAAHRQDGLLGPRRLVTSLWISFSVQSEGCLSCQNSPANRTAEAEIKAITPALRNDILVSSCKHDYGSNTMGARRKANFLPTSSITFTWQVYGPGANFASGIWKCTPPDCPFGDLGQPERLRLKCLNLPRKKLTLAEISAVFRVGSAPGS